MREAYIQINERTFQQPIKLQGLKWHMKLNDNSVRISMHGAVMSYQADTFGQCLGDHDAVKRIAMVVWQVAYCQSVGRGNRYFKITSVDQFLAQQGRVNARPLGTLDRQLPYAGSTEIQAISLVVDKLSRFAGKLGVAGCGPNQNVSVEQ